MSESCDRCSASCEHLDECIGEGIKFERLRRVTGYISGGGIDRMNDAKQAEVKDRTTENKRVEDYHK